MEISVEQVKQLREKTGVGLMDCKKALIEAEGDFDKAIEILRKKGAATSAKRSDKIAKEGITFAEISESRTDAAITEVNCETDFVARSEAFISFTEKLIKLILEKKKSDISELLKEKLNESVTLQDSFDELSAKIGEKVEIKRADFFNIEGGFFCKYNHIGNKIASVVGIKGNKTEQGITLGNNLAMQVVAMKPIAIERSQISKDIIDKEREIFITQAKNEGKSENIVGKIADNKVNKFFQENCLTEQEFVKEQGKPVSEIIKAVSKETGNDYSVSLIARYQLGENL